MCRLATIHFDINRRTDGQTDGRTTVSCQ